EPRRRRPPLGWLAAACAAGVVLGAGGILAADRLRDPASDPGATVATAELDTLDTGQRLGSATVSRQDDGVTLAVSARDLEAGPDGYVEVWLINRDGRRLVSVGVMRDGAESASFPISQRLLDEGYVVVDISREQFDDKPQHSGDSIVRGSLTTPA
ncbi:anti-sigma factor, partial [Knoellia aerolata]|uniref:anti-sigma factor n=1 Tax=Knoellia aerolata TaxID=442954 RepID=UPI00146FDE77